MKDWLDQQIRQAGRDATQNADPRCHLWLAGRMVALAQVRAEVWKLGAVSEREKDDTHG